ncbi:pyridoxal phosphate-dependent aminotransferase [bacterium]|nr:pyridoxal phosphate-dependent aminotransferase [bacterium]
MQIANRVQKVSPSLTLSITAKAKAMKKQGFDVVGFGAGEPDFDTPDYIKNSAKKALDDGKTKYTPVTGMAELKQVICDKFANENNLKYEPDNIAVSCGAKHSLYNYFQATINDGDEVIIPSPYWVSYPQQINLAGGIPVFVQTNKDAQFKITPDKLSHYITKKTKAVILNSPSNPSGMMYTQGEIKKLAEFFVDKNIAVVSDEIYEHITYGFPHVSIASFGDEIKQLTTIINGVSKSYSMTGWRIGYMAADKQIVKAVNKIQGHSTSSPNTMAQIASITALEGGLDSVKKMVDEFKIRRDYMCEKLNSINAIDCIVPQGAFYVFPSIAKLGLDSISFCEQLLEKFHVAAVPGAAFGNDANIRLSYAIDLSSIKKGLQRLEEFVKTL